MKLGDIILETGAVILNGTPETEIRAITSDSRKAAPGSLFIAVKGEKSVCPLKKGTLMDMMYMPDAQKAMIDIMEADPSKLVHRNSFNVTAMSFGSETIYEVIKKRYPNFEMVYEPEPIKQAIADSWPDNMDDSCARNEWGWNPQYDLERMTDDMILNLKKKLL